MRVPNSPVPSWRLPSSLSVAMPAPHVAGVRVEVHPGREVPAGGPRAGVPGLGAVGRRQGTAGMHGTDRGMELHMLLAEMGSLHDVIRSATLARRGEHRRPPSLPRRGQCYRQ
jgi:hypothetical protein